MKVLLINEVCGFGSTGKICTDIAKELRGIGHDVKVAYGRFSYTAKTNENDYIRIGNSRTVFLHALITRLYDAHGYGSKSATKKFLEWADSFEPDMIWLHNLHGYYINLELLFRWIKMRPKLKIQWTLHDCWAFTGHCAYFTMAKCDKWKGRCGKCPNKRDYPASWWIDRSEKNYRQKKELFCGIPNMLIITPSEWLASLVRQSFLAEYPIEVRYNTVDENIFKPTKSDFRKKYGLNGKKIILGVANIWDKRKGLDDFIKLSKMLDEKYAIVLIGLSPKQMKKIPSTIIGIHRVADARELAAIYSTSDVYVNASKEETFGMTTLEAIKCGAKTIVYDSTAGAELANKYDGIAVPEGVENLYQAIIELNRQC